MIISTIAIFIALNTFTCPNVHFPTRLWINYENAADIAVLLCEKLKIDKKSVACDVMSNTIILDASLIQTIQTRQLLSELDQPTECRIIRLKHQSVILGIKVLEDHLIIDKKVHIVIDVKNNYILINAKTNKIEQAIKCIKEFDVAGK